tara:strand:+ start:54 stop:302 length:249 start_codon:yes stop_codon:yes gene_type:complete
MTQQLNSVGQPETPLYIPFMEFTDREQCMTFARNNQIKLFNKSIQAYDKKVLPTKINCINEDMMKQVGQLTNQRGKNNEEDI